MTRNGYGVLRLHFFVPFWVCYLIVFGVLVCILFVMLLLSTLAFWFASEAIIIEVMSVFLHFMIFLTPYVSTCWLALSTI